MLVMAIATFPELASLIVTFHDVFCFIVAGQPKYMYSELQAVLHIYIAPSLS